MQLPIVSHTLNRPNLSAVGLHRKHRARLYRSAVKKHRARATIRCVAADVSAGQRQPFADEVDQQQPRLDLGSLIFTVYLDMDDSLCGHK